jgi:hypothetical protein
MAGIPAVGPLHHVGQREGVEMPGTGKTSLQRWWLCQLAPHPAAQIAVLDGKVANPEDGGYGLLLARCFAAADDDPEEANRLLGP